MNWWNRNKRWALPALIFFLLLSVGLLVLMVIGPIIGNVFCTLVDVVGDGVGITFVGDMPENYTVEVSGLPSGKRKISCNSAVSRDFIGSDQCVPSGVFFEQIDSKQPGDVLPEELVVEVAFDGKKISRTFHPEYEITYPNGERCAPMAYRTTIEFELSR